MNNKLKRSVESLAAAREELAEALRRAAVDEADLPEMGAGIRDMVQKVTRLPLREDATATVTSTRRVYKGDMVSLTHELAKEGDPLRVVADSGTLLAACSTRDVAVWCYAQDGEVYLKAGKPTNGAWTLGATVVVDIEVPDRMEMAYSRGQTGAGTITNYVTLVFKTAADTIEARSYLLGADLSFTLCRSETLGSGINFACAGARRLYGYNRYTDTDGVIAGSGDVMEWPYVPAAWETAEGNICLKVFCPCYETSASTANVYVLRRAIQNSAAPVTLMPGAYSRAATETRPAISFTLAAADGQEYTSGAWKMVWDGQQVFWLTYPGADGKRYVLEFTMQIETGTINMTPDISATGEATVDDVTDDLTPFPLDCKPMLQQGYTPCGAGVCYTPASPWLIGAIARTAGGTAQKAVIGMERWLGGRSQTLFPIGYLEGTDAISTNIGLLRACTVGPDGRAMAAAYLAEGQVQGFVVFDLDRSWGDMVGRTDWSGGQALIEPPEAESEQGPEVNLAVADTGLELVSLGEGAALLYQRDGQILLQRLKVVPVAATTKDRRSAGGVALSGGTPGNQIKIAMLKAVEEE